MSKKLTHHDLFANDNALFDTTIAYAKTSTHRMNQSKNSNGSKTMPHRTKKECGKRGSLPSFTSPTASINESESYRDEEYLKDTKQTNTESSVQQAIVLILDKATREELKVFETKVAKILVHYTVSSEDIAKFILEMTFKSQDSSRFFSKVSQYCMTLVELNYGTKRASDLRMLIIQKCKSYFEQLFQTPIVELDTLKWGSFCCFAACLCTVGVLDHKIINDALHTMLKDHDEKYKLLSSILLNEVYPDKVSTYSQDGEYCNGLKSTFDCEVMKTVATDNATSNLERSTLLDNNESSHPILQVDCNVDKKVSVKGESISETNQTLSENVNSMDKGDETNARREIKAVGPIKRFPLIQHDHVEVSALCQLSENVDQRTYQHANRYDRQDEWLVWRIARTSLVLSYLLAKNSLRVMFWFLGFQ